MAVWNVFMLLVMAENTCPACVTKKQDTFLQEALGVVEVLETTLYFVLFLITRGVMLAKDYLQTANLSFGNIWGLQRMQTAPLLGLRMWRRVHCSSA